MERITKIKDDKLAFYIGTTFMCKTCDINLEKINVIKKYFPKYNFYQIDSNNTTLINEYKIDKVPFFIISSNNEVKEIFYSIDNLESCFKKLNYYQEKHFN